MAFELRTKQSAASAKVVYERALLALDSDITLWLDYIQFLQRELKDIGLARAKFE